jgi:DNA-binding NarL/FixJ family response regulator
MLVVIAEDTAILRGGLVGLLEEEGHRVAAAVADGEALKAAVVEHRPDIVVSDIRMPPTRGASVQPDEGVRAALELRRRDPRLPVLLFSQYVDIC